MTSDAAFPRICAESTWEPAASLKNAKDAVAEYEDRLANGHDHDLNSMTLSQPTRLSSETSTTNASVLHPHNTTLERSHPREDRADSRRSGHQSRSPGHLSVPSNHDARGPSALDGGMPIGRVPDHREVKLPSPSTSRIRATLRECRSISASDRRLTART